MRIWHQRCACFFQQCYCKFTTDRGEVVKEDLERVTSLQVIEQDLDRYAGSKEHRRSAVNLRIDSDELRVHDRAAMND